MTSRITVISDAVGVSVRCDACGLTCPIPPVLAAARLQDFVEQHQADVDPALHSTDCPAWESTMPVGR